ncbi:acyl-CoA synthetase [Micromonospora endophytica]|uniref:p-hydroxycinnamoyl-CoA synthetase n=1 Tax=Micromonospora endophytica TaxID=515350 RepID=A0A2W2CQ56_9ACTN|nr:long-chain fatty acid--CoA ligase [Micromonospora endophytica]PZG00703.1 p-hydroxycinnamoyl-CoA synthetase [Micromonospora endophytica]RIW44825.1 p-hydroxycinnamoyl-CoA synthetase [Micromonospora endophytica]BCJ57552.1 fatty-acyl-CoA synthase [Micromonospora endophytica]
MHPHGIGAWLAKRRLKSPAKAALVQGEVTITYAQLADGADRVSALLHERGVGKGDTVAYLGENSPEFLLVMFGAARLGAVFVPVNTRLAPPEIAHVLTDCAARVLVHDPEFTDRVAAAVGTAGPAYVLTTGDGTPERPGLARLCGPAPAAPVDVEITLDDPAAIIYTSGTTGKAKGAVLTHGNLTWVALNCIVDYDVVSTDVALMISPLFHVASLGMGALPVILKGATMVLEKGFEPGRALAQIERHGVTMLSGVPTTYQLMAEHPNWAGTDLSTLAKLTCGGSAVPVPVLNAYEERGLSFSQGYGMTETAPGATALPAAMTRRKQGSVGLPHFFTDVRIAGSDGTTVPAGTVGEIEICGPNVFPGYHGLPAETASAFTTDGWFRSGDLGHLDDEGYLYISGRLKDMIISGGENIYPAELERLLGEIDGVTGVAVIGVPDARWGEVPWAVLTVRAGAAVDTDTVRRHLDGKVARYKLPKNVVIVDELPRTASGKVRKGDLRTRFGAEPA